MVLLDGLYPNGPVMEICRKNNWDFMIVLQNKSLPSVWEEYEGLKKLLPENCYRRKCSNRKQHFKWVNDIEYYYDVFKKQIVHVVVCEENWKKVDKDTGEIITKTSRHAWIKRFILFHDKRHPDEMGKPEIEAFLTHLAVNRNVAASTQNQAFNAILFLYNHVLDKDMPQGINALRSKKPVRVPTVMTRVEILNLIGVMRGTH